MNKDYLRQVLASIRHLAELPVSDQRLDDLETGFDTMVKSAKRMREVDVTDFAPASTFNAGRKAEQ